MNKRNSFKRILCMAIVAMLLVLTAAPAMAASSKNGAYVVSTSSKHDRLRVYNSEGTMIGKLRRGTVVVYKGHKGGWWKVQFRGGTGYLDKNYLLSVDLGLSSVKYTPVDNLWVRSKPKTNAYKMGKLKAGKKVTIERQKNGWVQINYKGYLGWVPAIYLKVA